MAGFSIIEVRDDGILTAITVSRFLNKVISEGYNEFGDVFYPRSRQYNYFFQVNLDTLIKRGYLESRPLVKVLTQSSIRQN